MMTNKKTLKTEALSKKSELNTFGNHHELVNIKIIDKGKSQWNKFKVLFFKIVKALLSFFAISGIIAMLSAFAKAIASGNSLAPYLKIAKVDLSS